MAKGWYLLGAPWDSSGTLRGEMLAPTALRAAGIAGLVEDDLGDVATIVRSRRRDAATGVLGLDETLRAARLLDAELHARMSERPAQRPLVVGGDCSILLGILPALRRSARRIALWFVDGHPDYQDGHGSETGETADMDLACATGRGPDPLVRLVDDPPMVDPEDVVLIGHRFRDLDEAAATETRRLPPGLHRIDADTLRADPEAAGRRAAALGGAPDTGVWLHIDLDVLDPGALSAVTYPQAGGPDWDQLTAALNPMTRSTRLIGVSVADLRPDLDPDGSLARRVTLLLQDTLP